MKISSIVLTRNNELTIERCLWSLSKIVDEIVILDTGSTDRTLKIAKRFTDKIYKTKFNNDFASLRNKAIDYTTGDWIISLDSDEELMGRGLREFLSSLEPRYMGVLIPIFSELHEGGILQSELVKIFRRGIYFEGKIHEVVSDYILKKGGEIYRTDQFVVLHHGYGDPEILKQKIKRNTDMLISALKSDPKNPRYLFYYLEKVLAGQISDSTLDPRKVINYIYSAYVDPMFKVRTLSTWLMFLLSRKTLAEAEIGIAINRLRTLDKKTADLFETFYHYRLKNWKQVYELGQQFLDDWKLNLDVGSMYIQSCLNLYKFEEGLETLDRLPRISSESYRYGAMCAYKLGKIDEARRLANLALNTNPLDPVATSLINVIDMDRYEDKPSKILLASPVRQDPKILKIVLESWANLNRGHHSIYYLFLDNNDNPESSKLLEEFPLPHTVIKCPPKLPYFKGSVHVWGIDSIAEVARIRNLYVSYALENGFDYLFAVDSDLKLEPDILLELMKWNKPVISPVFFTKTVGSEWAQVWLQDQYYSWVRTRWVPPSIEEQNRSREKFVEVLRNADTPVRVGGLGACTLIKREVLEKGANYSKIYNISFFGEDRDFCIRVVASGYDLWALASKKPLLEHLYYED